MNHKIFAIVLSLLLAIPVGLIVMPKPVKALITPELFVVPGWTEFDGPCQKGTTFSIDVWLLNMEISALSDIYAFDFSIDWATIIGDDNLPMIALVNGSIAVHSPWPSGGFFIVDQGTFNSFYPESNNPGGSTYHPAAKDYATNNDTLVAGFPRFLITDFHLSITAMPPKGTGLWDVNQSILTLTFQILDDVCWPNSYEFDPPTAGFLLQNVKVSGDGSKPHPLPDTHQDGAFAMVSFQPNIELKDAETVYSSSTHTMRLYEKCNSHETDVTIELTNISKVYGFGFEIIFDPQHLEVDLQKTTFKPGFPPPYEYLSAIPPTTPFGYIGGHYYVALDITIIRPSEKPTICGAEVPVFDVIFHVNDTADAAHTPPILPIQTVEWINLTAAFVLSKGCGEDSSVYEYDFGTPVGTLPYFGTGGTIFADPLGVPYNPASPATTMGLVYGFYGWQGSFAYSYADVPHGGGALYYPAPGDVEPAGYDGYWLYYNGIKVYFLPAAQDLNLDCVVDIQDLMVLLPWYTATMAYSSTAPTYAQLYTHSTGGVPDPTQLVDIFDFVAIAKKFGPVDP